MSPFPVPLARRDWQWFALGVLLALGVLGIYYATGWSRGERTDLLVMYRPGVGDKDYYPLARQFGEGRFGEGFTAGKIGEGWVGFPCASVLPHGLGLRALGPAGFALVDLTLPCVFFVLAARLLMCAGAVPRVALALALFAALQGFATLAAGLVAVFGYALHTVPFYLEFLQSWGLRFPRNFVSDLYVIGALGSWCELARCGAPARASWWIGLGAWMAAVLQSDVYSFAALGLACGALRVRQLRPAARPAPAGRNFALAAAAFFLLATPFLLQRAHLSPDVLVRYGVFPLARSRAVELAGMSWHFFPASFVLGTLALPWLLCAGARGLGRPQIYPAGLAAMFTVLQLAAYAAMPCFVALTGQGVQLYHFLDAARTLVAWTALIQLALVLSAWSQRRPMEKLQRRRWPLPAAAIGAALGVAAAFSSLREISARHLANPGPPRAVGGTPAAWSATYHEDWRALAIELERPATRSSRVLAATDGEIFSWWTSFRGGESFLAHAFVSGLPDSELQRRLLAFARLNQIAPDRLLPWLTTPGYSIIHSQWLSADREQATALHTASSLDDYTAAEGRSIAAARPLDCWHLIFPQSELRRLAAAYAATVLSGTALPDLLVLTRESAEPRPDPALFTLAYENRTFRLYRLRTAQAAPPARNY